MPLRLDAILHGILAWGLITLITLYLVITGVGTVIGGALSVVQQGMQSIGSVAPQAADMLSQPEVARILQEAGSGADGTRQDLSAALQQFFQEGSETNRQRVINILTERTQMSKAEARDTLAQLEQRYQQLRQDATDVAQEATNAVAMSAWWTFFALLAGAIAAAVGSALAAPRDLPAVPEVRRE
jgi:hypothetical protein